MKKIRLVSLGLGLALLLTAVPFAAFAKSDDDREAASKITLNISADVQAGESGGTVDVTVEEGECSVSSVDFIDEPEYWLGGQKPKVEIWLSADSGYYFKKSGKSAIKLEGDTAKLLSASPKNDKEEMLVKIQLEKLDEDDEDLDVQDLYFDERTGIVHWSHNDLADKYSVRLCRSKGTSNDNDGIGSTYSTSTDSYDFSGKFTKADDYYFKVKAIDKRGNSGDWEESGVFTITDEQIAAWKGSWQSDELGRWYVNYDGTYTTGDWQEIDGRWYYFDEAGYMMTGWIEVGGKAYYLDATGAMLVNTQAPDGSFLGADGARIDPLTATASDAVYDE